MGYSNRQDKFIPVKKIIDRERDEALAFFRKIDFESRLKSRLEKNFKPPGFSLLFWRKPVIVFSVLTLVCLAATVVIYQILSPSPYQKSVRIIESFLLKNTYLQEVLADEIIPEKERETITLCFEEELECWQNPKCRQKFFSQIISVFKEV